MSTIINLPKRTNQINHTNKYKVYRLPNGRLIQEAIGEHKKLLKNEIMPHLNLENFPINNAVYGLTESKDVKKCVKNHTGANFILKLDIKDFFASTTRSHIFNGISLNKQSNETMVLLDKILDQAMYISPNGIEHLPTGACTSPYLANIAAGKIDVEILDLLAKEKERISAEKIVYTRYLDDLTISIFGEKRRWNLIDDIRSIIYYNGYQINNKKTKWMSKKSDNMNILGISQSKNNTFRVKKKYYTELRNKLFLMAKNKTRLTKTEIGQLEYVKSVNEEQYEKLIAYYSKHFEKSERILSMEEIFSGENI